MLARKVGYMHYATSHKTAASGETNRVERRFGTVVMRVVFLVMLFCVFLLSGIALTSMKNNYSYTLSQKKQQVRQLQRITTRSACVLRRLRHRNGSIRLRRKT